MLALAAVVNLYPKIKNIGFTFRIRTINSISWANTVRNMLQRKHNAYFMLKITLKIKLGITNGLMSLLNGF